MRKVIQGEKIRGGGGGERGTSTLNNTTAVVREEYEGAVQAILSPATHHQTDK